MNKTQEIINALHKIQVSDKEKEIILKAYEQLAYL